MAVGSTVFEPRSKPGLFLTRLPDGTLEAVLILAVVAVGPLFYVARLGFYTDDWAFLADLQHSSDQSLSGLYAALSGPANVAVRPLQILLYIAYHKIAPGSALFPHIANQVMFAAALLILHSALRKISPLKSDAYYIVLIYACLPHYFTERLWYANHQSTLSLLFFALSSQIIVLIRQSPRTRPLWLIALFLCSAGCMLAYELFSFVLLGTPLFVACANGRRLSELPRDAAFLKATVAALAAFVLTTLFKMHVGSGLVPPRSATEFLAMALTMYKSVAFTDFWTLGLFAPVTAWNVLSGPYVDMQPIYGAAIVLGVVGAGEVLRWRLGDCRRADEASPLFLLAAGAAAFVLGFMPFLANFYYGDSPFGIDNRDNVAAAFGLALIVVGVLRLCALLSAVLARVAVIVCCVVGTILQIAVGQMWGDAWLVQQDAYQRILKTVGKLQPGDTVLLYGFCPYFGPTPIFAASWGLADRFRIDTGEDELLANTITQTAEVRPDGLLIIDDGTPTLYPYGGMRIVDLTAGTASAINDHQAAQAFFERNPVSRSTGCDYEDYAGVSIYGK